MRPQWIPILVLPLALGLGACFEGPERVESQPRPVARPAVAPADHDHDHPHDHGLPPNHPPIRPQLPPNHPPLPGAQGDFPHGASHGGHGDPTGEPIFAGRIELVGDLASRTQGGIFVIARAEGQPGSLLVRKLEIADGELRAEGARVFLFELSDQDSHGSQIPAQVQLEVYYDPDGIVETREGRVGTTVSAKRGDLDLSIVLDPAQAPEAGAY